MLPPLPKLTDLWMASMAIDKSNATTLTDDLVGHPGFTRVFQPGRLTFGFIAPLEGYPDSPAPTLRGH